MSVVEVMLREKFSIGALWKPIIITIIAMFVIGILATYLALVPLFIYFTFTSGNISGAIDSASFNFDSMWGQTLHQLLQNAGFVLIVLILLRGSKLPFLDRLSMGNLREAPKQFFSGVGIEIVLFLLPIGVAILLGVVAIQEYGFTNAGMAGVAISTVLILIQTLSIGIGEEVLARGYLQRTLTDRYGIAFALPVAAMVFALLHIPTIFIGGSQNPVTIVTIFVSALIFGYLFYKTGSLWICIGLHFATDFFNSQVISGMSGYAPFFAISQLTPILPSAPWLGDWINIILTGFYIIAFLVIILYYRHRGPAKPGSVVGDPSLKA